MVYVSYRGNVRKPRRSVRKRTSVRRRRTYTRSAPRRARRTYRRSMAKCKCPAELTPGAKFALAQLDPFEPTALGAKVPDSNTIPSIASSDVDIVTLAAPAVNNNLLATAFAPSITSSINTATEGAGAVTWTTTYAARRNATNITASIEAYRPVAHAVRLSCPLAPTAAGGFVHIGIDVESRVNSAAANTYDYPTTIAQMSGLAHYKRVTLASLTQTPLTVINKWIDDSGFRYDDPRSAYATAGSGSAPNPTVFNFQQSWGVIIVMIEGQQATGGAPLSAEHLLLSEYLPRKDSFLIGSQAAPNSPALLSATSRMVGEHDFAHNDIEQDSYTARGAQHLMAGLAQTGEQAYNQYAPQIFQAVGRGVGNAAMNWGVNLAAGLAGINGVNANPGRLSLQ